jgi:hypothetical protein
VRYHPHELYVDFGPRRRTRLIFDRFTDAVMESGFRREQKGFQRKGKLLKEDSLIHQIKWHRVILDEAHNIKDRGSNTAKAAFALKAKFRWCLSGELPPRRYLARSIAG